MFICAIFVPMKTQLYKRRKFQSGKPPARLTLLGIRIIIVVLHEYLNALHYAI